MAQEASKSMSRPMAYAVAAATVVTAGALLSYGLIVPALLIGGAASAVMVYNDYAGFKSKVGGLFGKIKSAFGVVSNDLSATAKDLDKKLTQDADKPSTLNGAKSGADFNTAAPKAEKPAVVATPAAKPALKP